jgi:hypothetical protein
MNTKMTKTNDEKIGLNLNSKHKSKEPRQNTRVKTKNMKCARSKKTSLYCNEVRKHKHEKNKIRLWCNIILQTNVEQTKSNWVSYFYLYPFVNLAQGSFHGSFHVATNHGNFFKYFLIINELQVN